MRVRVRQYAPSDDRRSERNAQAEQRYAVAELLRCGNAGRVFFKSSGLVVLCLVVRHSVVRSSLYVTRFTQLKPRLPVGCPSYR